VALDGSANLYIADTANHQIRKVTDERVYAIYLPIMIR
jgi:hypothetical protein